MNKINAAEYPIKTIFSKEFEFNIPSYQRPYSWGVTQAEELISDFLEFSKNQPEGETYFLGSIVLVKDESFPHSEVIDGQQRLTTLTILLSCIAEAVKDENTSSSFQKYINEPGDLVENLPSKPRLFLRDRDKEFFQKYIQDIKNISSLDKVLENINDSQKNIKKNALHFKRKLSTLSQEDIISLGSFIVNRCYLVGVSTPNLKSAYRIFSVLNNRGLDLLPSDLLKADLIGEIEADSQDFYNKKWEDYEEQLGREQFNDLFSHIRMIELNVKAKKSMLDEMKEQVLPKYSAKQFINEIVEPSVNSYANIIDCHIGNNFEKSNDSLHWLGRIDNSDWIPVAMAFLSQRPLDSDKTNSFFYYLERLATSMFLRRCGINQRLERYKDIYLFIKSELKSTSSFSETPLDLTQDEIDQTKELICGDIYHLSSRPRNFLMLKLDSIISDKSAIYNYKTLTIEHVLPQTIPSSSEWEKLWPSEERQQEWLHKLANLVLLSRSKNAQAQNYDFELKKEKYFNSRKGVTSFALTTGVLNEVSWTEETLKKRQEELTQYLFDYWMLK